MTGLSAHLSVWWSALLHPEEAGRLVLGERSGFTRTLSAVVALMYGVYGLTMGSFLGYVPALAAGVKLPTLFLFSLAVCFPALYGLNCRYGSRLRLKPCLRLLVLAISVNAVAVASYSLFSLFFALTTSVQGYQFLVMMHVVVFALSGIASLAEIALVFRATSRELGRPFQPAFLAGWCVLYALVGTQMSWMLRPWIGDPAARYEFIRARGGTFIEAVWDLTLNILHRL